MPLRMAQCVCYHVIVPLEPTAGPAGSNACQIRACETCGSSPLRCKPRKTPSLGVVAREPSCANPTGGLGTRSASHRKMRCRILAIHCGEHVNSLRFRCTISANASWFRRSGLRSSFSPRWIVCERPCILQPRVDNDRSNPALATGAMAQSVAERISPSL